VVQESSAKLVVGVEPSEEYIDSNFAFLLELEQKYGEDALIEYWYAKILTYKERYR
jgi:hypothetical protein